MVPWRPLGLNDSLGKLLHSWTWHIQGVPTMTLEKAFPGQKGTNIALGDSGEPGLLAQVPPVAVSAAPVRGQTFTFRLHFRELELRQTNSPVPSISFQVTSQQNTSLAPVSRLTSNRTCVPRLHSNKTAPPVYKPVLSLTTTNAEGNRN